MQWILLLSEYIHILELKHILMTLEYIVYQNI